MHPLARIVERFRNHRGLRAKSALRVVREVLGPTDWIGGPGDDAAALPLGEGHLLLAAEAIWPPFVAADPFGAGAAAVVANVNDVAAMGGRPEALVDTFVGPAETAPVAMTLGAGYAPRHTFAGREFQMARYLRRPHLLSTAMSVLAAVLLLAAAVPAAGGSRGAHLGAPADPAHTRAAPSVRFSTFNASLNRPAESQLVADLSSPDDPQAQVIAEIIQRIRPDVLLLTEFDFVEGGVAVDLFHDNYLTVAQHAEAEPIAYPHRMAFPSNTGLPSGFDLNRDGTVGGPEDAFGFGFFPGQFAFALFSRYPILEDRIRTFQFFRWIDMPGALLPGDPETPEEGDWYSEEILEVFRLSSKNHVDVPVQIGRDIVHILGSHPTPPAFDGPERRNVLRNHDEIRFWADYITPGRASNYIYDDGGVHGGLRPGARFVIAGDLNADPCDGDSVPGAIQQVLEHPLVAEEPIPESEGAVEQTELQGGINLEHCNPPEQDTADFSPAVGNLRVDYVLPRVGMRVTDAAVFWPTTDSELFHRLIGTFPFPGSDHRLVYIDVRLPVGGPVTPGRSRP